MQISFSQPSLPKAGTLVVGILPDRQPTKAAADVDGRTGGMISRAMAASRFSGKKDEILTVAAPAGLDVARVLLVGLGDPAKLTALTEQDLGGAIVAALNAAGESEAAVWLDALDGASLNPARLASELAYGARLRAYRFDKYRTKEKPEQKPTLAKLTVMAEGADEAARAFERLDRIADGVFLTRDMVSEPANVIYPESFADQCRKLTELGVEVEVLDEARMRELGMGALLGVGQGSARDSFLVVMRWNGGKQGAAPIAFVGKGVTFDTGGISIKPAAGMEDMKWDMGGAGAVLGAMKAIAGRKAKANVVGVVGLVENMPSGTAQRPGDVVTSMSGQTIEVINTDAEGRLVLADAMWYTQETYKPRAMIDLATLTGAMLIALGHEQAGLFANDDSLADQLLAAGKATGDLLWRMPLDDAYDKLISSEIADVRNTGHDRSAGSITAAKFLQRFVKDGTAWAHIDIAGVAWSKKDTGTCPKGGTGYGVRLLDRFVADVAEGGAA